MFGLWEIRLPTALMNKAGARNGPAGAFGMGLFVGEVAAPCVGGFIVGLLAFVAARQDPWLGFLFFFVLSLGLGLPYLFLGAFSGSLSRLPRAGAWMESVKKVFGWILLAMAAYFLRSVVPPPLGAWLMPGVLGVAILVILVRGSVKVARAGGVAALAWPSRFSFFPSCPQHSRSAALRRGQVRVLRRPAVTIFSGVVSAAWSWKANFFRRTGRKRWPCETLYKAE